MRIQVICIGKLKEKYWTDAVNEYMKRLSKYCDIEILELKESRLPDKASAARSCRMWKFRTQSPISDIVHFTIAADSGI